MRLFWKRPSEYWACYYLAHDEPYWSDVKISEKDAHIVIEKGGYVVSSLNTQTMLNHLIRGDDDQKPISIYTGDPLVSDGGQEIDLESPQGRAAWPHLKK